MTELPRLRRRSVVDEAAGLLRRRILAGQWAVGDRLPTEASLTRSLGVSRSTVREALNRLSSAGLILAPHSGSRTVAPWKHSAGLEILADLAQPADGEINLEVVRSITEMRAALAPDVARWAALRHQPDQLGALEQALAELATRQQPLEQLEAVMPWWTALVEASHNLAYRLAFNTLRRAYVEGRAAMVAIISTELGAVQHYRRVSRAVASRQPEQAATACHALVELGTRAMHQALRAADP